MKTPFTTVATLLVLIASLGLASADSPGDFDCDGIPDSLEAELLSTFAPVFKFDRDHETDDPPLPVDWYVNHCQLRWYDQKYMFFGWNDTDSGPDCPFGNHEGDVLGVEFEVEQDSVGQWSIVRATYQNHSRVIFVDSPGALEYDSGHPVVFIERESNEAVPWAGTCGFFTNGVPPCISTHEIYKPIIKFGYSFGVECEDFQTVREHRGPNPGDSTRRLLVTSVVNLGESGHPGPSAEAVFLNRYNGLFGDNAEDSCDVGTVPFKIKNVTSPHGPKFQPKMWDRALHGEPRDWESCKDLATVHVNFNYTGPESGMAGNPFNTLREGRSTVGVGGTIVLNGGTTSERPTLCRPVTITSANGVTTIGQ